MVLNGSRLVRGAYNPITDTASTTTSTYSGRGVISSYSIQEIDKMNILEGDQKLIALQNELTDTPQIKDKINSVFEVISVYQDPAKASYIVQLRQT